MFRPVIPVPHFFDHPNNTRSQNFSINCHILDHHCDWNSSGARAILGERLHFVVVVVVVATLGWWWFLTTRYISQLSDAKLLEWACSYELISCLLPDVTVSWPKILQYPNLWNPSGHPEFEPYFCQLFALFLILFPDWEHAATTRKLFRLFFGICFPLLNDC